MAKFNWAKSNMKTKVTTQGNYDLLKEADHILNTDNYWKRKIGKKHKKFFKKLNKNHKKNEIKRA